VLKFFKVIERMLKTKVVLNCFSSSEICELYENAVCAREGSYMCSNIWPFTTTGIVDGDTIIAVNASTIR